MAKDKKINSFKEPIHFHNLHPHKIFQILFIFIGLCGLSSCVTEDEPSNSGITTGDRLPDFSVTLNDGKVVTTGSLKGKMAVIELFNTGCSDCQRSLPVLESLWQEWKDDPEVEIFAIARAEEDKEIATYWTANDLSLPYSPQPDRKVYELFATVGIPRIYIADRSGIVIAAFGPEDESTLSHLNNILKNHRRLSPDAPQYFPTYFNIN